MNLVLCSDAMVTAGRSGAAMSLAIKINKEWPQRICNIAKDSELLIWINNRSKSEGISKALRNPLESQRLL